ncbi:MAG: hypothetical protein HGA49_06700 [Eubacteriaceae bacterium]|nr:hypothetical protein [Eubacteriaceae bacterium]
MSDFKSIIYILAITLPTLYILLRIFNTQLRKRKLGKSVKITDNRKIKIKYAIQLVVYYAFSQILITTLGQTETPQEMNLVRGYVSILLVVIFGTLIYYSLQKNGIYENGIQGEYGILYWDEIKNYNITKGKLTKDEVILLNSNKRLLFKNVRLEVPEKSNSDFVRIIKKKTQVLKK